MITQEMVEVATAAGKDQLPCEIDANIFTAMEAAITSVYPLIRNAVLEEAAKAIDSRLKLLGDINNGLRSGHPSNYFMVTEAKWLENKECATEIRSLKDKTNEEHNG